MIEFIELENDGNKKTVHLSQVKEIKTWHDSEGYFLFMEVEMLWGEKFNSKSKNEHYINQ